jgi:lipopolysaccharide biosynthesis glycosyltransferase
MVRIFIGYDRSEAVAYHVLCHSIMETAEYPVCITPVMLDHLSVFSRPRENQSTDFSFSRFLVPFLSGYAGWSIFMDCDFLCFTDIHELWKQRDDKYDVMCVKHEHKPKHGIKFLGNVQTRYERKNWSSLMMFNNARCTELTPEYVNTASGMDLHQFKWCSKIGSIDPKWNHLVNYDAYDPEPYMVHYTEGGPYFQEYAGCPYAPQWFATRDRMNYASQTDISKVG